MLSPPEQAADGRVLLHMLDEARTPSPESQRQDRTPGCAKRGASLVYCSQSIYLELLL